MRAKTAAWLLVTLLAPLIQTDARAAIYLGGSYGWLKNSIYKSLPVGSPYQGGGGQGYEVGFDIGAFVLSGELGPSYNQPTRNLATTKALGLAAPGKYKVQLGNVMFKLEPIEDVQPYLLLGGGQGVFTIDYGKGMRRGTRFLKNESLKSWVGEAGFGFDAPLRSWLLWGFRARFLYNRWRPTTDANLFPPYQSGNGYSIDARLMIRI